MRLACQRLDPRTEALDTRFDIDFRNAQTNRRWLFDRLPCASAQSGPDLVEHMFARHQRSRHICRKLFAAGGGRSLWLSHAFNGANWTTVGRRRIQPPPSADGASDAAAIP